MPESTIGTDPAYRDAFAASPFPFALIAEKDGRVIDCNAALLARLGIKDSVIAGTRQPWSRALAGQWRAEPDMATSNQTQVCAANDVMLCATLVPGSEPALLLCYVEGERPSSIDSMAVQHGIRNGLAVVGSIFRATVRSSGSVDDLAAHFLGRFDAISRLYSNVVLYYRHGAVLYDLLMEELRPHMAHDAATVRLSGPDIRLGVKAARAFVLLGHELTTNSVKYGVLGSGRGAIDISWQTVGADPPRLQWLWQEAGIETADRDLSHYGFGRQLVGDILPFDLGAQSSMRFLEDRLEVRVELALTADIVHSDEGGALPIG